MSYLYVVENGAVLSIDGGYIVVHCKDGLIRKMPKETVESIALFGNISLTTPCVQQCLERGIPVNYFSKRGSYFGRLESTRHKNIARLKAQLLLTEDEAFCLTLSRNILDAKISNQQVILRRYARTSGADVSASLTMMKNMQKKLQYARTINELIGYEGTAAKSYFEGLSKLVRPEFAFSGRNRMPPKDAFNSMLSLGYTLLMYEIYGEIENKGLSPYGGFLHQDHERHPTLASDLMEEWRAVIVDSVVMSLVQGCEIEPGSFVRDEESGGVYIDDAGMRIFLRKMEAKLRSETGYLESSYRMSFRKALWHQANELTGAIEAGDPALYHPIRIR